MIDAGYDDIDFITEVTAEELEEIGITKKGREETVVQLGGDVTGAPCTWIGGVGANYIMCSG